MVFLSQLLNKKVYYDRKIFGEMIDFAVHERTPNPSVCKIVVKRQWDKNNYCP